MRSIRPSALLLVGALAGCTSYGARLPIETLPNNKTDRDPYEVWAHGDRQVLIALRRTPDSLTGIPSWRPPACDSCRVRFALSEVDSVRVKRFDGNKTLLLAVIVTPILMALSAAGGMADYNY